jgi:hypothetical protein
MTKRTNEPIIFTRLPGGLVAVSRRLAGRTREHVFQAPRRSPAASAKLGVSSPWLAAAVRDFQMSRFRSLARIP